MVWAVQNGIPAGTWYLLGSNPSKYQVPAGIQGFSSVTHVSPVTEYTNPRKFAEAAERAFGIVPRHNIWLAVGRWVRKHPTRASLGVVACGVAVWGLTRLAKIIMPGLDPELMILPPSEAGKAQYIDIGTPLRMRLPTGRFLERWGDPFVEGVISLQSQPLPWDARLRDLRDRLERMRNDLRADQEKVEELSRSKGGQNPLDPRKYLRSYSRLASLREAIQDYEGTIDEVERDNFFEREILLPLEEIERGLGSYEVLMPAEIVGVLLGLRWLVAALVREIDGMLRGRRISGEGQNAMLQEIEKLREEMNRIRDAHRVH